MLEPVGVKTTEWSEEIPIECPTEENPFLRTAKNSATPKSSQVIRYRSAPEKVTEQKCEFGRW